MITDLLVQIFGSGLKRGMKNIIFWSEIGPGFQEPCGTPTIPDVNQNFKIRALHIQSVHIYFLLFFVCV